MPRAPGQVDEAKSEAILDAARALFHEKGLSASMAEIARRAGVSKQTLYNRFASKLEIGRALAGRRSLAITASLSRDDDPQAVLSDVAEALIAKICVEDQGGLRGVALLSPEAPEIARAIYDAGPGESLRKLATWLADQDAKGRLSAPDPAHAAEVFTGMALGHAHLRAVLGLPHPALNDVRARAQETARRFLRAYAPDTDRARP